MNLKKRLNLEYAQPTRSLILLGATGSIGKTTLNYLRRIKKIKLDAISIHQSIGDLENLIEEFHPRYIVITNEEKYNEFIKKFKKSNIEIYKGQEGLIEVIKNSNADTVLTAVVGASGILSTIEAIKKEKKICLANKETLITAGPIILNLLKNFKSPIIPVDSEHNALFQLMINQNLENVNKIILTASGGPLRDKTLEELKNITMEEVLNHPTWKMGPKITVDSAGLINKGLEVIEAHYLFGFSYNDIEVKIHKNSYVHGMIQLKDGSYMLSISPPNMIFPIAYSLHFPEPLPEILKEHQYPEEWPMISFESVDKKKYIGFDLCIQAGKIGHSAPTILNASNEVAVELFLNKKIHFLDIPSIIQDALNNIPIVKIENIDILIKIDKQTREYVYSKSNEQINNIINK